MVATKKKSSFLSFVFRFGLSAALLIFIFSKIDTAKTLEAIKGADPLYLIYALVVFFIIHFIILFRWWIVIQALGLKVTFFNALRYFFIGLFGNLFLPTAVGGDIIRVVGLCRNSGQKPKVVASVILDRMSGFAAIVLIAVPAYFLGYQYHQESSLLIPISLIGAGSIVILFVLFNEKVYGFCCQIFALFPKVKNALMSVHYDLALLKDRKREGVKAVLISCISQSIFAGTYFLIAQALHQDINFLYFLIFVPLICVSSIVPSIGGLGVREGMAVYLFMKIGIDSGIAVSLTLINFLFMVIIGALGGVFYALTPESHHPSIEDIPETVESVS